MSGYREIRKLGSDRLRSLCIEKNWYCNGTNKAYENLLHMANKDNITTDDIVAMAEDIKAHSCGLYDATSIMFYIAQKCTCIFEEV